MPKGDTKTAMIIGASRGLGLALAHEFLLRDWSVIGTVRGSNRSPLHDIAEKFPQRLQIESLNMTDPLSMKAMLERLPAHQLDLLFVNAGIAYGADDQVDKISTEDFSNIMITNALSPLRIVEGLGHLVKQDGTIGVMSSSLGSISLNDRGGWEVYRASKAALNTLMRSYAARHANDKRCLALVDPGWVRTDMGGAEANLNIEESIPGVVNALEAQRGKSGLRYFNYQGQTVPW